MPWILGVFSATRTEFVSGLFMTCRLSFGRVARDPTRAETSVNAGDKGGFIEPAWLKVRAADWNPDAFPGREQISLIAVK
jgi:hypothetical protein